MISFVKNKNKFLIKIIILLIVAYYLWIELSNIINNCYELSKSSKTRRFIFIGGRQRSGTTLMRAILDVHPKVKCGNEVLTIGNYLTYIERFKIPWTDVDISKNIIDEASVNFISTIMTSRNFTSERPCVKDPDLLMFAYKLYQLFPNAKFVFMIRDGRAAAYSRILALKQEPTFETFLKYLRNWYNFNKVVLSQCDKIGPNNCLKIRYEDLVSHPEPVLKKVLAFLDLEWNDELLKHHDHIDKDVLLTIKTVWNHHHVQRPIFSNTIYQWYGKIKDFEEEDTRFVEPLLNQFNYSFEIDKNKKF